VSRAYSPPSPIALHLYSMFQLLRRISGTFTRRFDWEQDGNSSDAPRVGSKRRMSDDDDDVVGSLSKRSRKHDDGAQDEASEGTASVPATPLLGPITGKETEDVREVTKGVKEVELEDDERNEATSEEAATDEQTQADDESYSAPPAELQAPDEEAKQTTAADESVEEKDDQDTSASEEVPKNAVEDLPAAEESEKTSLEESAPAEVPSSLKETTSSSDIAQITSVEGTVTSEDVQSEASPLTETPTKPQ